MDRRKGEEGENIFRAPRSELMLVAGYSGIGKSALVEEFYQAIAKKRGFSCFLSPLKKILREGNSAQQWLKQIEGGSDSRSIIVQGIQAMARQEWELEDNLCPQLVAWGSGTEEQAWQIDQNI